MRVRVYRNLNKNTFSMLEKTVKGWRLKGHYDQIFLKNVRFLVYDSGRLRVLAQKRKNVHAFIEGELDTSEHAHLCYREVTYNPYEAARFFEKSSGKWVGASKYCVIKNRQVLVYF